MKDHPHSSAIPAGAAYFAAVFAAGFALGTVRTLFLAPRLGETGAVLAELPVMLAISWLACGWALRRFAVPAQPPARFIMGLTAFALLMAAELALAIFLFGETAADFAAALAAPPGALGLAGQIAFGLMPLVRR